MAMPMPKQQDIRRLDRQGVSRSEIARRLDVDRATVAKYADMDGMTPKPPMDRRRGSKIDPYAELVDGWLEADRMLPRKQRHTAKRVHGRLRAETDYDGEYTTTLRYVRRWREANRSGSDGYGELVWAPGVAQIDFGVAKARIAGELVDGHCLVVTFPTPIRTCATQRACPGRTRNACATGRSRCSSTSEASLPRSSWTTPPARDAGTRRER